MANEIKEKECRIYNLWDVVIVTGAGRNNKLAALTGVWDNKPTKFFIAPLENVVKHAVADEKLSSIEYKLPRMMFDQYEVSQAVFDLITEK